MSGIGKNRVILVGFMGVGKTSIGKRLAVILGYDFLETDRLVEDEAKEDIKSIFDSKGESRFRECERKVLTKLANGVFDGQAPGLVVATGGGEILDPENRKHLHKAGTIIWLTLPLIRLLERISYGTTRALLDNVTGEDSVVDLVREREPFYAEANFTVDTSENDIEASAQLIAEFVGGSF